MYRQYLRFFKLPLSLKVILDKHSLTDGCLIVHNVHNSSCCQKQINFYGEQRVPGLSRLLVPITPTGITISKFYSQNSKREPIMAEVLDRDAAINSIPNSEAENNCQYDKSESLLNDQSDLFEDIDIEEITGGDEDKLNKFKLLMLEIDVLRQDGMNVPSKMSTSQWKELFSLQSKNQKRKLLTFLFKSEMKKLNDKRKKEVKRLARIEKSADVCEDSSNENIQYGFRGSTICLRIYDSTMNNYDNYRLIRAMMFGQNLVIDCGFYNEMTHMENKLCCKQLVYMFAENRLSKEPFNLHFCNLKKNSSFYGYLLKSIPTIEDPDFPINIHEGHYLDLFSKNELVYLTPHCHTELREFNPNDIYIIGAIVDKVNTQPLTLAKAKSEGLRMAKLPLDRYLDWSVGNKSLTINQVIQIMHDVQVTGDWTKALKHVPKRKIRQHDPSHPVRDPRQPRNRGTTFQPPERFMKYY